MSDHKEQLEILKHWWNNYGKVALLAFILVVVALFVWQSYQSRQERIAQAASGLYEDLAKVIKGTSAKRYEEAQKLIVKINEQHPDTIYVDYANLFSAKLAVEKKDFDAAKLALQKVIDTSSIDIVKEVAQYRLVRILVMQKKYPEALGVIAEQSEANSMIGEFYILQGDIYLEQGKVMEAKEAYQKAKETGISSRDPINKFKTDRLGSE